MGRKTAQRLAFHLLKAPRQEVEGLAAALVDLRDKVRECKVCGFIADAELCPICADPRRDAAMLCVVEEATTVAALERTRSFAGLYHVLGGALSPLATSAHDLRVRGLVERVQEGNVREVVLATSPTVEGEATAVYLSRLLKPLGVRVTRLAQGLPAGADLEFHRRFDAPTVPRGPQGILRLAPPFSTTLN